MTHEYQSLLTRKPEALNLLQISKSTLHVRINEGLIAPPVQIGVRAVSFVRTEIMAVIAAQIAGCSKDEKKALVKSLVAQRQELLPNFTNTLPDKCVEEKEPTPLRDLSTDSLDYRHKNLTHRTPMPNPSIFDGV
jgi:prophage regulatory protein